MFEIHLIKTLDAGRRYDFSLALLHYKIVGLHKELEKVVEDGLMERIEDSAEYSLYRTIQSISDEVLNKLVDNITIHYSELLEQKIVGFSRSE